MGEALRGSNLGEFWLGEFWRYRVGDWRVVCQIQDAQLVVLALRAGHRRHVYDR
jgi:mRNA interferase RelE/StbE